MRLLHLRPAASVLDELVTTTYNLEQVNQGWDLRGGKNIRGVIVH